MHLLNTAPRTVRHRICRDVSRRPSRSPAEVSALSLNKGQALRRNDYGENNLGEKTSLAAHLLNLVTRQKSRCGSVMLHGAQRAGEGRKSRSAFGSLGATKNMRSDVSCRLSFQDTKISNLKVNNIKQNANWKLLSKRLST